MIFNIFSIQTSITTNKQDSFNAILLEITYVRHTAVPRFYEDSKTSLMLLLSKKQRTNKCHKNKVYWYEVSLL